GLAQVRRQAPCHRIEALDLGDRKGALCVVSHSPLDLDPERLIACRTFLAPVLRPGYPAPLEDVGQPLTSLVGPLWLYAGPPVPLSVRFVFADGHAAKGPVIEGEWTRHDASRVSQRSKCWLDPGAGLDADH